MSRLPERKSSKYERACQNALDDVIRACRDPERNTAVAQALRKHLSEPYSNDLKQRVMILMALADRFENGQVPATLLT